MLLLYITILLVLQSLFGCSDRWGSSPEDAFPSSSSSEAMSSSSSGQNVVPWSSIEGISSFNVQDVCPNLEESYLLTDCRDNQVYTVDTIGSKIWMTENLRYVSVVGRTWCYKDSVGNCKQKGRLYDWNAATESCPFGWHLPDTSEWSELVVSLGGRAIAGSKMWFPDPFAAKPSGYYFAGEYNAGEQNCYWWSSVEYEGVYAKYEYLKQGSDTLYGDGHFKDNGFAVRCTKNLPSSSSGGSGNNFSSSFSCGKTYQGISESIFIDERDQQEYGAVRICSQEWMTGNLNYSANNSIGTCLDQSQCDAGLGRWYTWSEMMGPGWENMHIMVVIEQIFPGICPSGWHLPDNGDLDALFRYVFSEQEPSALAQAQNEGDEATLFLGAAKYLKGIAPGLDFWNQSAYNAGDPFHFGVLPSGGVWSASESLGRDSEAALWYLSRLPGGGSGGQGIVYQATGMRFRDESSILDHFWGTEAHALPVRCVRAARD